MSHPFRIFLPLLLLISSACGEIQIVPLDTAPEDALTDTGDAVALPLSVTIESPHNGASVNIGETIHFSALVTGGTVAYDLLTATWTTADKKVLATGPLDAAGRSAFDKADLPAGPQSLHVEVTDGNGAHAGRDLGLLINTPPTAPAVSIKPDKPTTLDDLVPVLTKPPTDIDRAPDKLHVRFDWHKAGETTVHPGGANGELTAGTHKRGEAWIVTAIANDGTGDSPGATAQVVIGDAPPNLPVLKITPANADLLSDVTCELATPASDVDGDAVTLAWGWRVGAYVNPGVTTQTVNIDKLASDAKGTSLLAGAQVYCTAIASDDQVSAPLATSPTLTVQAFDVCKSKLNPCDKKATCVNSSTLEPTCTCNSGFTGDGYFCLDIDECASGYCSVNANCNNTIGGFQCTCKDGYTGNGVTCTDVNECQATPGPCGFNGACTNQDGSYVCTCQPGYSGDGMTCKDIDECQIVPEVCDANAACKNSIGSHTCTCDKGFLGDGSFCVDIDECLDGTTGCSPDSNCTNKPGGFFCLCKPGYKGDGKICVQQDECQNGDAICSPDATCTDTPGSYTCTCKTGFTGDGKDCTDIDECATGALTCGAHAACKNTVPGAQCVCQTGYFMDATGACVNINECAAAVYPCDVNASCADTDGSYACTCNGPIYSGSGKYCSQNDLCKTTTCANNATCAMVGADPICTCDSGYSGFGNIGCTEVDECALGIATCSGSATCTNTPGSYTCACNAGFTGDGFTCVDVNECAATVSPCAVDATCKNTPGSFTCNCKPGYSGYGTTCADIDECAAAVPPCSASATCTNSLGSFQCACNAGFAGDGVTCTDINECVLGTAGCAADATCSNSPGGFQCACNAGFTGDGKTCTDINECTNGAANCSPNAACNNTPGSFNCACKSGFSGDGKTCTDIDECPGIDWAWDFSSMGVSGWTLDPPNLYAPSNPQSSGVPPSVAWQLWNGVLYYGNPAAGNYATAVGGDTWANKGNATGPSVTLSSHPWHHLGFDVLINTDVGTYYDKFLVQLVIGSGATEQVVTVWDKASQTAAMGVNKHYTVYLNGYGGKSVRVRFAFDTVDGGNNATHGVEVSNLSIHGAGTPCNPYAECANTPGSFTCTCNAPYAGDGIQTCNVLGSQNQPAANCKAIFDLDGALADGFYWLKWTAAPATQMWCDSAGWTRVVQNDFNASAGGWSPKTLTTCGSSGLLGGVGVAGKNYAMSDSVGSLPSHSQMRVQGTVQCIDAWIGEAVMLQVDGLQVWTDTVVNPIATGSTPDSCGNTTLADLKRYPKATFDHASANAIIQFSSTLNSDAATASYGIDDINVWVK